MKNKTKRNVTTILMAVYLIVMTWIILMKTQFSFHYLTAPRSINLIPFAGSMIVNGKVQIDEIISNILIFAPLGVYISMLKPEWSFLKKAAPAACISFLYEAIQYIFAIGATDITDLIGNTLGGILGIGVYFLFLKLCRTREKTHTVLNVLAAAGTLSMLSLMALVLLANL